MLSLNTLSLLTGQTEKKLFDLTFNKNEMCGYIPEYALPIKKIKVCPICLSEKNLIEGKIGKNY